MVIFNALLNLRELKELYSGKPVCVCPLYKGSIGTTKRFETSGNPVVIPKYVALEKLNVEFLPKQAGTGDPSPDNVRPISGWDPVQVAYKLATPEPFEISKISIPSLIGENTFFTNGNNMDIIYKKALFWSDEA